MALRRIALLLVCLAAGRPACADSPNLGRITPRGGQRGTELELTLSGSQLKDAKEVFLYKTGLEILSLEATGDGAVKLKVKIAADAPLGEHPMRLRTASGISDLRTFYVGPFPALEEKEPNTKFTEPQRIPLGVTVTGTVKLEDVDHFAVELKKGERLTAEMEGVRLGTTLFDGYISILDTQRFEIASSDDTALLLQDPLVSIEAPQDGTYIIQVRETSYGGNDACQYRLHVGSFPRPLAVYPPGGKAGEELDATFLGDVKGPLARKIKLPAANDRFPLYVEDAGQSPPSPNWIRVSDFPNVLEKEPNDAREQATATDLPLPVALNGIIEKKGDEDWFRFKARKGETFDVRVYARAVRSPLDPVLEIWQAGGARIAANDDQGGLDANIRFTAPADGAYEIKVRDHLKKGGPAFVYRVEFNAVKAGVYAHIPAYDREPRDQTRQWVVVPKGNRFATWIRVNRTGFGGAMDLSFEGLPEGITVASEPVAADVDRVPVVFEAAPDAKVAGSLARVIARTADPATKIEGEFRQDVNLVYGPPNNTIYYGTRVDRLAVAVVEEVPFKLRLVESKVPLVQSGSMGLRVVAERKEGFTGPIELRLLWAPPGVAAQVTVTLPAGQNEIAYPINANRNAAPRTWKTAVIGSGAGSNGTAWASTQLAPLTVAPPFVAMKIAMANAEQGKEVDVVCKVDHLKPFEGKAKVTIFGLPPGCTAEPAEKEITKDDKQVVFRVKTDKASPAGQHKSLFAQIAVPDQGDFMFHNVGGGGVLRIDPARKDASAPKPGEAKPAQPKAQSRLEQLRQEAGETKK
ncbi:MAG TPA: peptidase [Planctomycetota bacterium]|nr:peptidase [Planctomycetota bacterium]